MKAKFNRLINVVIIFLLGGASTTIAALATGASQTPEHALQPGTYTSLEVGVQWPWPTRLSVKTCRPGPDLTCTTPQPTKRETNAQQE